MLTVTDIKKLHGGSFELWNREDEAMMRFEILPASQSPKIQPGAEAYGLCADCKTPEETIPTFLKIFRQTVPVRNQRNRFLVELELAKRHWVFRGVPFGFLLRREVQDVEIHGNISYQIQTREGQIAPSVAFLMNQDRWSYSPAVRARFAGHLCCAVHALETLGLVHGDLSLGNVVLGWEETVGEVAILVDYDGFYHPKVPLLPLKFGKFEIRRIGSIGFQAPFLMSEIRDDPDRACVRSDRMALAALITQLMIWDSQMADDLGREELLDEQIIQTRDLRALRELSGRWPAGFELLEQAFSAASYEDMPSPRRWLAAVGGPAMGPPWLLVSRDRTAFSKRVRLTSDSGSLGRVHPELAEVRFQRDGGERVTLRFDWSGPILGPIPRPSDLSSGRSVELSPGGSVSSKFWRFKMVRSPLIPNTPKKSPTT